MTEIIHSSTTCLFQTNQTPSTGNISSFTKGILNIKNSNKSALSVQSQAVKYQLSTKC